MNSPATSPTRAAVWLRRGALPRWLLGLATSAFLLAPGLFAAEPGLPDGAAALGELAGLHNVQRMNERVFSGSSPETDADFAALAKLGIRTVISVDGAKPAVEAARRHGLRYVHLPLGYDRVPSERAVELVKAARTFPGPLYIHCHHGKHRGPAAAAALCRALDGWTASVATNWMVRAGTAAQYGGLFRSVAEFIPPTEEALAKVGPLPEVSVTSSLVEAMVAIDAHWERLKAASAAQWVEVPGQPDATPAHEALLLWEQFQELLRLPDTTGRGDAYRQRMVTGADTAAALRAALEKHPAEPVPSAVFRAVQASCTDCHRAHRD